MPVDQSIEHSARNQRILGPIPVLAQLIRKSRFHCKRDDDRLDWPKIGISQPARTSIPISMALD